MTTNIQRIHELIDKVRFVIEDENKNIIDVIEEQEDLECTDVKIILAVKYHLIVRNREKVFVKYNSKDSSVGIYVLKHSVSVDDGYIAFHEYVTREISDLVTSMYRKRQLEKMKENDKK